jgi:site-specific DNA-methyltransferase (adenine-specific)
VTKYGGIVVWIVGDATIKGSETGTSFKQALYFMQCGFNLHDTMIYEKNSSSFPASRNSQRYTQIFEYMFVLSKGQIRKDISLLCDKKNKWSGFTNWGNNTQYDIDGNLKTTSNIKPIPDYSLRNNIWKYTVGFNDKTSHPAVFPEKLAEDHILSWSNEGDVVLDPFMGSGTVAKMAIRNNRKCVGIEISEEYCKIIKDRIDDNLELFNI